MRRSWLMVLSALALVVPSTSVARPSIDDPCREPGETAVTLRASDGARLYGVEVGNGSVGVVLAHQYGSSHCEFMPFARELAGLGYRTLSIDLRGDGASRVGRGAGTRLDRDIAAAVARLRADGATRIKLIGASMGATAVLVAAASIVPRVDGVVSLSAPATYNGLDALRAVKRSRVPARFLVGILDRPFATDARTLTRNALAEDKAILRLPGAVHGSSLLELPRGKAFVLAFLAK